MSITPQTGCDDRSEKDLPVEDLNAHRRTQTCSRVPKASKGIALSVMLVSIIALACVGCVAAGSSTVPKRSAGNAKQVSTSEPGVPQNSQIGTLITTLKGHNGSVSDLSFSPDGQTIVASSGDGSVNLWKRDGTLITSLKGFERGTSENLSFSSDGQTLPGRFAPRKQAAHGYVLAASNGNDLLRLWKRDGTIITTLKQNYIGLSSRFSPDGQTIVSGGVDSQKKGIINLWKRDGTLIKTLKENSQGVSAVNFSPDGQLIVSGNADGIIKLWKPDGTLITTVTAHKEGGFLGATGVGDIRFSPDGQVFASIGIGDVIKLWRRDGTLITTLKDNNANAVTAIQFSPDGQTIASSSWGDAGTITLWKRDGTRIKTWRGDVRHVQSVSFSPDGQVLASGGLDKTIKLWKVN
jgi:WD40 repeat protein